MGRASRRAPGPPSRNPMTEIEKAYIAGFFDGEGSVAINKRRGAPPCLSVRIFQSEETILHWVKAVFGGGSIHRRSPNRSDHAVKETRPRYQWAADSAAAREFLTAIRPFVKVKSQQVDLALAEDACLVKARRRYGSAACNRGHLLTEHAYPGTRRCATCARMAASERARRSAESSGRIYRPGAHGPEKRATCQRGHPMNEVNVYLYKGKRRCKACMAMRARAYRKAVVA